MDRMEEGRRGGGKKDGQMVGWDGWMDGQMYKWIDGWMLDGQMSGWMDGELMGR